MMPLTPKEMSQPETTTPSTTIPKPPKPPPAHNTTAPPSSTFTCPLTNSGKVTERFHRPDYGHLTIDVTIDDAKAYTRPWSTAIRLIAVPDTEMLDAQCLENEKDVPHLLNAK